MQPEKSLLRTNSDTIRVVSLYPHQSVLGHLGGPKLPCRGWDVLATANERLSVHAREIGAEAVMAAPKLLSVRGRMGCGATADGEARFCYRPAGRSAVPAAIVSGLVEALRGAEPFSPGLGSTATTWPLVSGSLVSLRSITRCRRG